MTEALTFAGFIAVPGLGLLVHRAGLAHSIRVAGNFLYSLAVAIDAFRSEFKRLNAASREMK